jgi:hypothetical protein
VERGPAQRRVGVVEDRQVELGNERHGGATYRVAMVRLAGGWEWSAAWSASRWVPCTSAGCASARC